MQDARYRDEQRWFGEVFPCTIPAKEGPGLLALAADIPLSKIDSAHLLPKPNANARGLRTFGLGFPSFRNLSGMNRSGSGYCFGSREMALERKS